MSATSRSNLSRRRLIALLGAAPAAAALVAKAPSARAAAEGMEWQPGDTVPLVEGKQIIIAARAEKSQTYVYNVVFYYKPMDVLYGGPGISVRREDIEWWSEIPTPA